jgi:serine/threonine protein kinase
MPDFLSPEALDFLLLCFNRVPRDRPNATRLLQHPFVIVAAVVASPLNNAAHNNHNNYSNHHHQRPPSAASSLHGEGYPEAPDTSPSLPTTVSMTGDELTRALAASPAAAGGVARGGAYPGGGSLPAVAPVAPAPAVVAVAVAVRG